MDRLVELPLRPLVMSAELMEFAYRDDDAIYLVTYTPRAGAPTDPTKLEFNVMQEIYDPAGARISPDWRRMTHTVYNDPSAAIGTPAGETPAVQIEANIAACVDRMVGLLPGLTDPTPLHEQLAPPA